MTEQEIEINNENIVSINDLNKILEISDLKDTCVSIFFQNEISKVDIAFMAGLFLIHKKKNTKFIIKGSISENRIYEIRQYLSQFQHLFECNWSSFLVDINFLNISVQDELIENKLVDKIDFVSSASFVPILNINDADYEKLFKTKIKEIDEKSSVRVLCRKYLKNIIQKGKRTIEPNHLKSNTIIKDLLPNLGPIYTFVFSILHNKIDPFQGINKNNKTKIETALQSTKQLWEFTKEYVKGLDELAKNIIEHSSKGNGMITIRAYDKEEDKIANGKVLQTHVFDFGDTGIIDKLKKSTNDNVETNKIYEDDLQILDTNYSLENFINPSIENKLNQQLYRDLAHYGLTKFYKLIQRNEGTIVSSTHSNTIPNNRDVYRSSNNSINPISIGTNYFFELPFNPNLFKDSDQQSTNETSLQGTAQTIGGLSEILKYSVVHDIKDLTEQTDIIFNLKPRITNVGNREDERKLCDEIESLKSKSNVKYIAINMKDIQLSASSLLRFMAHLSFNFQQPIILYNLDFEKHNEMIADNKLFYSTVKDLNNEIPYWYDNKSVLVFSTIAEPNYHFADILFGKNEDEFNSINQIVSYTFPNTNSILNEKSKKDNSFSIPDCLTPYFHQSALLPFDILFEDEESNSLFQSNLSTILDNKIKQA